MAIKNGRIPYKQLRMVDGWAYLAPGAAAAWLLFAFKAQLRWGIRPLITRPDGAYRSYARQLYWWINRKVFGVVVAPPGTSNHGLGMAIDIYNWASFPHTAFVQLAAEHRFYFDTRSENWHVRYLGAPDYYPLVSASTVQAVLITEEDTPMKLITLTDAKNAWVALNLTTGDYELTRDKAQADQWSRIIGRATKASNADVNEMIRVIKATAA